MGSYVVIVHLHAKEGCAQQLIDTLKVNMEATHREPGLKRFALHRDLSDPLHFMVVEVYKGRADYDYHHAQPHYAVCMRELPKYLDEMHQSTHLDQLPIGDLRKGLLD